MRLRVSSLPYFLLSGLFTVALLVTLTTCTNSFIRCDDELGCIAIGANDPIRVATLLPLSGDAAFLGEDARGGVVIAIADYDGKLLGHDIVLVDEDSGCDPERGQAAAESIVTQPAIVGVIGPSCSDVAVTAIPVISRAGLVMLSPSNTLPSLTEADASKDGLWQRGYFRTAHNNLLQGQIAAEYAYSALFEDHLTTYNRLLENRNALDYNLHGSDRRTAAVIYDSDPYTTGLQQVFSQTFRELGGIIPSANVIAFDDDQILVDLAGLASRSPQFLYLAVFEPEAQYIIHHVAELPGLADTIIIGTDGLLVANFAQKAGASADCLYLSGTAVVGPAYDNFLRKWQELFADPPPANYHAHAYDATLLLLNAVEQVAQGESGGTLLIGRQALRDALAATQNFNGLTGRLACNQSGDCATGEALGIYQLTSAETAGERWPPEVVWTRRGPTETRNCYQEK